MKVVASYFKMKPTRLLVIRWLAYRWFFIEWECFRPSLYVCTYNWKNTFAFAVSGHDSSLIPLQFFLSFRPLEDKRSSGEQMRVTTRKFRSWYPNVTAFALQINPFAISTWLQILHTDQIHTLWVNWKVKSISFYYLVQYHFIIYYDFNYLCDHNAN